MMLRDEYFMERCFHLAKNGFGHVSPNPMVGCVLVYEDKIIGEGFHQMFGSPHAEPTAIANVQDPTLLSKSTLYVNLEPCSHFGKTPPCADLIIEKGIKNVVVCNLDPNPLVSGKGVRKLQESGINVRTGISEAKGRDLNKRFFTFMTKKRPYIILKWAQTLDGFMDIDREEKPLENYWITNNRLKTFVHKWRAEEDAIMVGTNTIRNDNPLLTTREWVGRNPIRITIDKVLGLPKTSHFFNSEAKTFVYNFKQDKTTENVSYIKVDSFNVLQGVLSDLYQRGVQSVIVEGGYVLLSSFISLNLWDEARVLVGNKVFMKGLNAPVLVSSPESVFSVDEDDILFYRN